MLARLQNIYAMELSLLQSLIRIPSIFPNETALAQWLYDYLRDAGWNVKKQDVGEQRFNVLAEKGDALRAVMLYGHLDTVPVYGEWDTPPFELTERGDQLFGLGATDMKGGIFVILEAIKSLPERLNKTIKLAFCVDEENDSLGAYALSRDPFLQNVALVLVPEICDVYPKKEGTISVGLGRRGRVGISLAVPGISAHGANPERGVNAIHEAYKVIAALDAMPLISHEKLGQSTQFIQEIHARSGSLSLPDLCEVYLSRLLVLPETPDDALRDVQKHLDRLYAQGILTTQRGKRVLAKLADRETPYYHPYITDERLPIIQRLLQRVQTFGEVCVGYGRSVADENIFGGINQIPTITLGPQGGNEHTANEWVSKQSLEERIAIYRDLMKHLELE